MNAVGQKLLRAVKAHYFAEKEKAEAALTVYLNNSVGIGEHPQLVDEMIKLVNQIHDADGCLETIDKLVKTDIPENK